jgi:glycosyltransferase 2 family protein
MLIKKAAQAGISLILTLLIGYLVYRGVPDWGQAMKVMVQGRPAMLLAGVAMVLVHMFLRAARWGVLLRPVKSDISFRNLFSLTVVKYVVNVIPPRTGEVAASIVLARKEKIPAASVIAASLLERILDLLTVVILFGVYVVAFGDLYTPASERGRDILLRAQDYSMKSFVAVWVGFAALAFMLRTPRIFERIPWKIRKHLVPFLEGFRGLASRGAAAKAALLSLAIWTSITTQLWFFTRAYLPSYPYSGTLLLMVLTVVGVAIPTPAGVGGFQFFMSLALVNLFSQYLSPQDPQSQAAGISNGIYLASMVPALLLGLVFLNYEGLTLGRLSRLSEQAATREADQP